MRELTERDARKALPAEQKIRELKAMIALNTAFMGINEKDLKNDSFFLSEYGKNGELFIDLIHNLYCTGYKDNYQQATRLIEKFTQEVTEEDFFSLIRVSIRNRSACNKQVQVLLSVFYLLVCDFYGNGTLYYSEERGLFRSSIFSDDIASMFDFAILFLAPPWASLFNLWKDVNLPDAKTVQKWYHSRDLTLKGIDVVSLLSNGVATGCIIPYFVTMVAIVTLQSLFGVENVMCPAVSISAEMTDLLICSEQNGKSSQAVLAAILYCEVLPADLLWYRKVITNSSGTYYVLKKPIGSWSEIRIREVVSSDNEQSYLQVIAGNRLTNMGHSLIIPMCSLNSVPFFTAFKNDFSLLNITLGLLGLIPKVREVVDGLTIERVTQILEKTRAYIMIEDITPEKLLEDLKRYAEHRIYSLEQRLENNVIKSIPAEVEHWIQALGAEMSCIEVTTNKEVEDRDLELEEEAKQFFCLDVGERRLNPRIINAYLQSRDHKKEEEELNSF